ncbi:sensor histidine kinase [Chryseosolibacter indicus]|uniref:histidine kinase n=1 Tax=Chryseosolibacter indicus TaxID=2782351 RepID=A0ABS5VSH2_9BACT|nr:ATP-binding protein [Chryseosolibacter indicus]MBT1704380.1 CHASE3 domain-containing protein [Chryseosolibacter indicus]
MKISYLIFIGFLVILIMFSATTYINFKQAERVNENSEFFARSTTIVRHTNRFQRNILNMVSGLRGYLFTGENYFIQAYDSAAQENIDILAELDTIVPDTSVQKRALRQIRQLNDEWVNNYAIPLIEAKKMSLTSDSSKHAFDELYRERLLSGVEMRLNRRLQQMFKDFSNYEYNLRDLRKSELTESIILTKRISIYLTSVSIICGLAIAIFLAYRISNRIMKMVKMADNIAAGDYNVHTTAEGNDEIGSLARSLNHMASVLSENISLLKRKNEELGQFAHIVSHDLKAPLRGIDNVVNWIEEDHLDELSPKVKEYFQLIKGRLVRGENLIQGILTYARIGREQPVIELVDLNELMGEILENVAATSTVAIDVQKDLPVFETEKIPLQQIFSNLIGNAIKYNDKRNGKIKIYARKSPSYYTFFVEDNGPGIDKAYHDKIFMIFQTLQERDSFESTGVGLAIVKKILDDRRQSIKLTSTVGKGSVFSFTWPK